MRNKFHIIIAILLTSFGIKPSNAQGDLDPGVLHVHLEQCYEWARENYPMIHQLNAIERTAHYNISNASIGNLPQINIKGQATYQSDVTGLPITIPGVEVPELSKDQYKIYGELYQPITNFANVGTNKDIIKLSSEIEKQKIEVNLYQLKERVNQVFFGILLLGDKAEQLELIREDLLASIKKIEAAITNGTSSTADLQMMQVEKLSIDEQIEENLANRKTYIDMLAILTGQQILAVNSQVKFVTPQALMPNEEIHRPELTLYSLQLQNFDLLKKQNNNSLIPNIGLFLQGGYGRPALNFLSNEFDFYYIGGLRMDWSLTNLYSHKKNNKILESKASIIDAQRETFLLNTRLTRSQQNSEIKKYEHLISMDKQVVALREDIQSTAEVQLENGLITAIDYVKIINDVSKAKQQLILHQTQMLLAQYNHKTTTGN